MGNTPVTSSSSSSNVCVQLGIKPQHLINSNLYESLWKKLDKNNDDKLSMREARRFFKHFAKAVGAPYSKKAAKKLIVECIQESDPSKPAAEVNTGHEFRTKMDYAFFIPFSKDSEKYVSREQFDIIFLKAMQHGHYKVELSKSLKHQLNLSKTTLWKKTDLKSSESASVLDESIQSHNSVSYSAAEPEDKDEIDFFFEGTKNECPFELVTVDELYQHINHNMEEIAAIIGVRPAEVPLILQLFDWNKDNLYAHYFEKPEEYSRAAGILLPDNSQQSQTTTDNFECPVCFNETTFEDSFALACGHRQCRDCWRAHLSSITHDYGGRMIWSGKCTHPKCPLVLNKDEWEMLAAPEIYAKYLKFWAKKYVDGNNTEFSICPGDCGRAVRNLKGTPLHSDVVECRCGKQFCFSCGVEYHNPVTCSQVQHWHSRVSADKDQDSIKLVTAMAKPCPNHKCGIPTDRIDGCNHMTCQKCGHQWCWQCRGVWAEHGQRSGGFYFCNKYATSEAKKLDEEADKIIEEHNRFLHYYNGYFVNDRAEKASLTEEVELKGKNYKELTGADPQFLIESMKTLTKSRHILKFTYVYGFFLKEEEDIYHKEMFEVQQAYAQNICERLAKELLNEDGKLDRGKIVYLTKACKQYFSNLVEFFQSDFTEFYSVDEKTRKKRLKNCKNDKKSAKQQTSYWICPRCTFGNVNTNTECEGCEMSRTEAERINMENNNNIDININNNNNNLLNNNNDNNNVNLHNIDNINFQGFNFHPNGAENNPPLFEGL